MSTSGETSRGASRDCNATKVVGKCVRAPTPLASETSAESVGAQAARIRHSDSAGLAWCMGQRSPSRALGQHIASATTQTAANWHPSQTRATDRRKRTERMNLDILPNRAREERPKIKIVLRTLILTAVLVFGFHGISYAQA